MREADTRFLGCWAGASITVHLGYTREILVDIFCRVLEEAFKFIPGPLQTKQTLHRDNE